MTAAQVGEFGTTTTLATRAEAEAYGRRVASGRGWEFVRVERVGNDAWTPVWRYPEEGAL